MEMLTKPYKPKVYLSMNWIKNGLVPHKVFIIRDIVAGILQARFLTVPILKLTSENDFRAQ